MSINLIKKARTRTTNVKFVNPAGRHGGKGSTLAHKEISKLISESKNLDEFITKINSWADNRLLGGRNALPEEILINL